MTSGNQTSLATDRKFRSQVALLIIWNRDTTFARVDCRLGRRRRKFVVEREIQWDAFECRENGVEINQWRQWNHSLNAADRREFDRLGRRRRFVSGLEIRGDFFECRENGFETKQWRRWNQRLGAADRREFDAPARRW